MITVYYRSNHLNSHRSVQQLRVDGWNIETSEEMSIHVIGSSNVVNSSSIVEQVVRLIGQEVAVNHRRQSQVVHNRVWQKKKTNNGHGLHDI